MNNIVLRFSRSESDLSKDDTIVIRPVWTACSHGVELLEYAVVMTIASCATVSRQPHSYKQVLSTTNFRKYLYGILNLLAADTQPFVNIQVDIPSVPSVLFKQSTLNANAWSIMNLVDVTLDSWAKTVRTPGSPEDRVEA